MMRIVIAFAFSMLSFAQSLSQDSYAYLKGGYDSLYKAIKSETILPDSCGQTGKVFVIFYFTESGTTRDAKIAKGICPEADSIALTIVKRLNYIPAKRSGKNIVITQQLPIYFTMEEERNSE